MTGYGDVAADLAAGQYVDSNTSAIVYGLLAVAEAIDGLGRRIEAGRDTTRPDIGDADPSPSAGPYCEQTNDRGRRCTLIRGHASAWHVHGTGRYIDAVWS